jgi:hypothetical protein
MTNSFLAQSVVCEEEEDDDEEEDTCDSHSVDSSENPCDHDHDTCSTQVDIRNLALIYEYVLEQ